MEVKTLILKLVSKIMLHVGNVLVNSPLLGYATIDEAASSMRSAPTIE
jgi:hypothetical protein